MISEATQTTPRPTTPSEAVTSPTPSQYTTPAPFPDPSSTSTSTDTNYPPTAIRITQLQPSQYPCAIPRLVQLHIDSINDNNRLSFLLPLSPEKIAKITSYWQSLTASVLDETLTVFVAHDMVFPNPNFYGVVMLARCQSENAAHRAEVWRLIVSTKMRRAGIATRLMRAMEDLAWSLGRWMLMLDTETGSGAVGFYEERGWVKIGTMPDYGLKPDRSRLTGETFYYKDLRVGRAEGAAA